MASTLKLNQIVAIEKGVKQRVYNEITELHKATQKADLLTGFAKTYAKEQTDGLDLPPENKRVQVIASETLKRVSALMGELFDVEATKDWGNTLARADITIDGKVLVAEAPVPFLLFLEKQLRDLRAYVASIVTLDDNHEWKLDAASNLWKAEPVKTHRTEKKQKSLTLAQATEKHPAQAVQITEDILVGYWSTTHHSGAIPRTMQLKLLGRIDTLAAAVKQARERANETPIEKKAPSAAVLGYVFAE